MDTITLNEGLLRNIVQRFCRNNPNLDREELLNESRVFALEAAADYKQNRGAKLSSWIGLRVWRGLCRLTKYRNKRSGFAKPETRDHSSIPQQVGFNVASLLGEVSEDAAKVIQIALKEECSGFRLKLLLKEMKWPLGAIMSVFQEIHAALVDDARERKAS